MLDITIIISYLILISIIGLKSGRGIKTIKDYAIYTQPRSTTMLVAIMCASMIGGGSTIGTVDKYASIGIIFLFTSLGTLVDRLLTACVIAPNIAKYHGMISVGDIMGHLYGNPGRIITGIAGMLVCIGYVGAQIVAMGVLFHHFFIIPHTWGMLAGACIVVVYSTIGGIKTATGTDLVQFGLMIIALPVICNIVLMQVGGYENLLNMLPSTHLTFFPNKELSYKYIGIFFVFCVPYLSPDYIQRILMVKDIKQMQKTLIITALLGIPISFLLLSIGLSASILNPNLNANDAFPFIIGEILPQGIKGLAIAGMLAVIMSMAESKLNVASVLLVHDVINPVRFLLSKHITFFFGKKNILFDELKLARRITFILGSMATFCAFKFTNIIDMVLSFMNFWTPIIVIPLIAGVLGIKAKPSSFCYAVAAGLVSVIIWRNFPVLESNLGFDSLFIGLIANIITFFVSHMIQKRNIHKTLPCIEEGEVKISTSRFLAPLWRKSFSRKGLVIKSAMDYLSYFSRKRVEYFGAQYKVFGIFAVLNYIVPYFMWSYVPTEHQKIVIGMRIISAALCFFLIAKDDWPKKLSPYLPLYWHFTLLFCLPFSTTYMLFLCQSSTLWMMNMALSLFLLAVLVDWLSFIIILSVGAGGGYLFYQIMGGDFTWSHFNAEDAFLSSYTYVFAVVIGCLFSRNKDQLQQKIVTVREEANGILTEKVKERTSELEHALAVKTEFLNNTSHEIRTPVQAITAISDGLVSNWKNFPEQERYALAERVAANANRLFSLVNNILDVSKSVAGKMVFICEKVDLLLLLHEMIKECKETYIAEKDIRILFNPTPTSTPITEAYSFLDSNRITQVLRNLFSNASKFMVRGTLTVGLHKTVIQEEGRKRSFWHVTLKDEGDGIPEAELENIFEPFVQSSRTKTAAGGTGLGLAICKEIIYGHQGKIWAKNNEGERGSTFNILLPVMEENTSDTYNAISYNNEGKEAKQSMIMNRSLTVLVVDDEPDCLLSLELIFTRLPQCKVITAAGGIEGLEKCRLHAEEIDVVLLDLMMQDMHGMEVLKEIKTDPHLQHILVILQSGTSDQPEIERAKTLGIAGFVAKPYKKEEIFKSIDGVIGLPEKT